MDPTTSTRRAFTQALISVPIPEDADQDWKSLATNLQSLLRALGQHPAMAENLDQPFMTPANYKNKVYFMWDFTGRTLSQVLALDPRNPKEGPGKAQWEDAFGRAQFGSVLIQDGSGKLETMCPDSRGQSVQFGREVEEIAQRM